MFFSLVELIVYTIIIGLVFYQPRHRRIDFINCVLAGALLNYVFLWYLGLLSPSFLEGLMSYDFGLLFNAINSFFS